MSLPTPFILSALHSPRYTPPSAHQQTPKPSLLSRQKWPSQQSLLLHRQIPLPLLWPDSNQPSQVSPDAILRRPRPCFTSSFQLPSQTSPFLYQQTPENLELFLNWPLKISPLNSTNQPSFFSSSLQVPVQTVPSLQKYFPCPDRTPFSKLPTYLSLLMYSSSPTPSGRSLSISPTQTLPSEHTSLPFPFFLFCLNSPTQIYPLSLFLQYPFPSFTPFLHMPSQYSSGELNMPEPSRWSLAQFPEQKLPSSQQQVPTPCFWSVTSSPSQISPLLKRQQPWPWNESFFQVPKQISPLGQVQMPWPSLALEVIWPMQWPPSGYLTSI